MRQQRVVINSQSSSWSKICAGVPQGSILGPILFLVYINDIIVDIRSHVRLFADDTSLYMSVENPQTTASILSNDLAKMHVWAQKWLVNFNPAKTESLLISRRLIKPNHPNIIFQQTIVQEVNFHKHLGIIFSSDASWNYHINYIMEKARKRLCILRSYKHLFDRNALEILYNSFIRPVLEYSDVLWDNCSETCKNQLESIQIDAARIVTGVTKLCSIQKLYEEVGWDTLQERRRKHKLILFYKMVNNLSPDYLSSLVPPLVGENNPYNVRNAHNFRTIEARTTLFYNSFLPSVVREWNNLPLETRNAPSLSSFKSLLNINKKKIPKHFYTGKRKAQILHARLRLECSSLNSHLYHKNISVSPLCKCGENETVHHYLLNCRLYINQRNVHLSQLPCGVSLSILLNGSPDLDFAANCEIFSKVHAYIMSTKRFDN